MQDLEDASEERECCLLVLNLVTCRIVGMHRKPMWYTYLPPHMTCILLLRIVGMHRKPMWSQAQTGSCGTR